jgi:carotenoid cleavage dioxygenase-like enzyme
MPDLEPVDPSTHPYLSGRFAPISDEVEVSGLEVQGTLPEGLVGAYLRNGPNEMFPPLGSYTFPMEGDAMVHGVWFDGEGGARYKNRWVRTKGMAADIAAGRDVFGGLMTPTFVDAGLLGDDPDPGWPFRLDPFINVVRHAGKYLALSEGLPGYEITRDLDTVGLYDFGGRLKGMCAHPRFDPATGEMVVFAYDVEAPFLVWSIVGPDGSLTTGPNVVPDIDEGFMIHDFTITPTYLVLVVAPVAFDLDAMMSGGDVLAWKPELGTRIALVPRDGSEVRWLETDPFFVWHFGNGYEDGADVVVDFSWWSSFSLSPDAKKSGAFTQMRLSPDPGTVSLTHLDHEISEFARIDDRLCGQPHRYVTVSRKSGRLPGMLAGEFDRLVRHDMQTGESVSCTGDLVFGEVVHAARAGAPVGRGDSELDGWYLTYATELDCSRSYVLVWDAQTFPSEPVAKVVLPHRVPNGLHGNWLPAEG